MTLMPENAWAVVLLFLLTLLLLAGALAALFWSLGRKRTRRAVRVAEGMGVVLAIYAGALLTHSITSQDRVLEPGQQKCLCEIDCHLGYSVAGVETRPFLGDGPAERRAAGNFYAVAVRTRFDRNTISSARGDSLLRPNRRRVILEDDRGQVYLPSREGLQALESEGKGGIPVDRPLRPGESYSTSLVFDLPAEARNPRLLIAEDLLVTRLLIGHENSFLHKKIWFRVSLPGPE